MFPALLKLKFANDPQTHLIRSQKSDIPAMISSLLFIILAAIALVITFLFFRAILLPVIFWVVALALIAQFL